MAFYNKNENKTKLIKIDPNKTKIMQASGPTFTVPQFIEIMNRQDFNVSSTITTSAPTFTVPQFVDVINHQDFNALSTIATTSRPTFTVVPSSFIHSQPVDSADNIERSLVKTKASLSSSGDAPTENWTESEIQLLLERRLSMNNKFENPSSRKTPYWNLIVKAFEEKGYKVTVQDLINKWKNLQVTYNRNASKLKRTGESAITWKYFQQMHEIFAEKKSVNPSEKSLGSTFKLETLTLKDESTNESDEKENTDIFEDIPKKRKRTSKNEKTQFQEKMLQIVEQKKSESLQFKKEMWEEKKKLATSKIEAINNLASIIKEKKNSTT